MTTFRLCTLLSTLGWILLWTAPAFCEPPDQKTGVDRVRVGEPALAFAAGFIRPSLPQDGVVSQISGDTVSGGNRILLGANETIFLRLSGSRQVAAGDALTLYRRISEVFHPFTGQLLGNLYAIVGIVNVTKVTQDLASARIVRAYGPITPGDSAMQFVPPPPPEAAPSGRQPPVAQGTIVAIPPQHFLIGQGQAVYIDQGRRDGLYVGDRLEVFRVTTGLPMRLIGEIKVLAVEESTATTQIVRSLVPFLKGDRVTFKPPVAKELAKGAEGAAPAESVSEELERPESASRESEAKEAPQEAQAGQQSPEALLADLARQLEFDPGQAPVKPKGLPILKRIGEILKQIPDKRARIEGHADDRPIGPSLKGLFPGNQELSEARAAGVVQYLVEEEGVDPSTLSAVGHGDTKPVADNKTEAGRKQNRRIEIVLLPKEPPAPPSAPGGPAEAPPPAPAQPQTATPPASTPPAP